MKIQSRAPRRFGPGRLALIVILIVLSALLANSIFGAKSSVEGKKVAELAYLDDVRDLVNKSNEQIASLDSLRNQLSTSTDSKALSSDQISSELNSIRKDANATRMAAFRLEPPSSLRSANSLLTATMSLRFEALDNIREAMRAATKGNDAGSTEALGEISKMLGISDQNYLLMIDQLPDRIKSDANLPASVWLHTDIDWSAQDIEALITSWKATSSSTSVTDVGILTVSTDPAPVRVLEDDSGKYELLPAQGNVNVSIVVANLGNRPANNLSVHVTIQAADGSNDGKFDTVSLNPGDRKTMLFKNIRAMKNGISILKVTIQAPSGDTNTGNNEKVIRFTMNPTVNAQTTTTTVSTDTAAAN